MLQINQDEWWLRTIQFNVVVYIFLLIFIFIQSNINPQQQQPTERLWSLCRVRMNTNHRHLDHAELKTQSSLNNNTTQHTQFSSFPDLVHKKVVRSCARASSYSPSSMMPCVYLTSAQPQLIEFSFFFL